MSSSICVLGAGVVGLTTALELQDRIPNASVCIVSEKFNTETTSDGAAGLFCPFGSFQAPTPEMTKDIVKNSFVYYDNLRKNIGGRETGICETSGFVLSNIGQEFVENELIEKVVPEYRLLTAEELKKCPAEGEWKYGCYFKTLIIQGRHFLPWALTRFQDRGGKVIQLKVASFSDLLPYKFDFVVNCTGIGARFLCNDEELVPIRGQVMKVSAPWENQFFLVDNDVYVIPGINETTLGGCRHYDNYDLNVDKHISAQIWENCTKLLPSLKDSAVIREWVGLRPFRRPLRLETEIMDISGTKLTVVHNYGHGAQGVTTAPGSAIVAVQLVIEALNRVSKL